MASLGILLDKKHERSLRHGLILFLESLCLYLVAGYEMHFAWAQTLDGLRTILNSELLHFLEVKPGEGMRDVLSRLSQDYPAENHRMWFSVLEELYQSSAGMVEAVRNTAHTLRDEQTRDLENHVRNLPTLMNVILILFFFPPTLALIFAPLLFEFTHLFG